MQCAPYLCMSQSTTAHVHLLGTRRPSTKTKSTPSHEPSPSADTSFLGGSQNFALPAPTPPIHTASSLPARRMDISSTQTRRKSAFSRGSRRGRLFVSSDCFCGEVCDRFDGIDPVNVEVGPSADLCCGAGDLTLRLALLGVTRTYVCNLMTGAWATEIT